MKSIFRRLIAVFAVLALVAGGITSPSTPAHATLTTTTNSTIALGNGVTTVFSYNFIIPNASQAVIIYTDADGVSTTLNPSQYTITGLNNSAGGTVTYPTAGSPIANGTTLTISRVVPYVQTTAIASQGPTFRAIENALDYLTMQTQQLANQTSPVPVSNGGTGDTSLANYSLLYGNGVLPVGTISPGASGTCLQSQGTGAVPAYAACPGGGTVTSVATDWTLTGGPITSSGTLGIPDYAWTDTASATTTDIGAVNSYNINITGTTAITSLGNTGNQGRYRMLKFAGALTLTYNATSLIVPGAANITTAAGDTALAVKDSTANGYWRIVWYQKASGAALLLATGAEAQAGTDTVKTVVPSALKSAVSVSPQNSQSAAYELVLADAGKTIYHPSADTTPRTFTIPANASVAFDVGTMITFVNDSSAGAITIAITSDTLMQAGTGSTGSRTLAATGMCTIVKITSTKWIISGSGLT